MLAKTIRKSVPLCATLLVGCLSPPDGVDIPVASSGYTVDKSDFAIEFSPKARSGDVPLRALIHVTGPISAVDLPTLQLSFGSNKKTSCFGDLVSVTTRMLKDAVEVRPVHLLLPDRWYCLRFEVREGVDAIQQTFETVELPSPTHELWPPARSAIPSNLDSFRIIAPTSLKELINWEVVFSAGEQVPLTFSTEDCAFEGEPRSCLQVFPTRVLDHGDATLGLRRDDDLTITSTYSVRDPDYRSPSLRPIGCMPGAEALQDSTLCVRATASDVALLLQLDEPALIRWQSGVLHGWVRAPFGEGRVVIDDRTDPMGIELLIYDLAGNVSQARLTLTGQLRTAPVTIITLRANPRGPEPRQELLTLFNHGTKTIDLHDYQLGSTLAEAQKLPDFALGAGQRVVLVPPDFDPHHPEDEPPPVGLPILSLREKIRARGVSNQGERVQLWDPAGAWVSGVPAMKSGSGECLRRRRSVGHADLSRHFVLSSCFGPLP